MNPTAAAITLARYYAKREAKAQMQREGLKPQWAEPSVINARAQVYLAEHRAELIEQAMAFIATNPALTRMVRRSDINTDAQPARPSSAKGIAVQMSCTKWRKEWEQRLAMRVLAPMVKRSTRRSPPSGL
jgi:hypothetical protein